MLIFAGRRIYEYPTNRPVSSIHVLWHFQAFSGHWEEDESGGGVGWRLGTVAGAAATPTAPKSPLRNWMDGRVQRYEGGLAGTANGGMAWGQTRGI